MFNEYPYTDYHELNTDWIIGKIKNVETAEANTKQYAEDADAAKVAAEDAKDIAVQAKDDAVEAKDDAVHAKDDAEDARDAVIGTQQQIDLLQARVDNIIPDGTQTAGNTELLDIRVGANGYTYDSAGNAVRGQVSDLQSALSVSETVINYGNIQSGNGYLNKTTGNLVPDTGWYSTDYIDFREGNKILYNLEGNTAVGSIVFYNDYKGFVSSISAQSSGALFTGIETAPANTYYIRVCFAYGSAERFANQFAYIENTDAKKAEQDIDQFKNLIASVGLEESAPYVYSTSLQSNGFLSKTGVLTAGNGYYTSDYIDVAVYKKIHFVLESHVNIGSVCFYDRGKIFISSVVGATSGTENFEKVLDIPSEAKYIRYTMDISGIERNKAENVELYGFTNFNVYSFYDSSVNNGYLNQANGNVVSDLTWYTSDYIEVCENLSITYLLESHTAVGSITFYDENKIFLSNIVGITTGENMEGVALVPSGAYYMKFSMYKNNIARNTLQYVKFDAVANLNGLIGRKNNRTVDNSIIPYSIQKGINYSGKNIIFFGDSIMYGTTTQDDPYTPTVNNLPNLFCARTGATMKHNYAMPGSVIWEYQPGAYSLLEQMNSVSDWDADCVILNGGTNDWGIGLTLSSVETALRQTLTYLQQHTNARVIYILPINCNARASVNPIYPMETIRKMIADCVLEFGYEYVDGGLMGFPTENNDLSNVVLAADGIHPTEAGYKMFERTFSGYVL